MIEHEHPTGHLRFIEDIPGPMSGLFIHQTTGVLQQRWNIYNDIDGQFLYPEWRDVPTEVEES
jgi:hypothetical protein